MMGAGPGIVGGAGPGIVGCPGATRFVLDIITLGWGG